MMFLGQFFLSTGALFLVWRKGAAFDNFVRWQVIRLRQSIAAKPDPLGENIEWIQSVQGCLRAGLDLRGTIDRHPLRSGTQTEALASLLHSGIEQGMPVGEALSSLKKSFALQRRSQRRAKALTTQARLQGFVAALLPPIVGMAIFLIEPAFILGAENRPIALPLLFVAGCLELGGIAWMRALVKNCFSPANSLKGEMDEFLSPLLSFIIGRLALGLDVERAFHDSAAAFPRARRLAKALAASTNEPFPLPLPHILAAKDRALAMGAPLRSLLAEVLEDFESAREAELEEIAQALPVKLLLPLFACIFPANLLILMIPALPAFQGL